MTYSTINYYVYLFFHIDKYCCMCDFNSISKWLDSLYNCVSRTIYSLKREFIKIFSTYKINIFDKECCLKASAGGTRGTQSYLRRCCRPYYHWVMIKKKKKKKKKKKNPTLHTNYITSFTWNGAHLMVDPTPCERTVCN